MNILDTLSEKGNLQRLWSLFPDARLVGGAVRDLLAGKPVADIDMATPESPERVLGMLRDAGIKAIPTGIDHGTVTAIVNRHSYEITTLRKDVRTDGRHAQVVWTDDWREDAARRDFTMNALYCDKEGRLWDYFNGQADLLQGKVRFIGQARARITEDYLRILRFFRFYARYGQGDPDQEAIQAIREQANELALLSAERVWAELQKIMVGPVADKIMGMMDETGVLPVIMPFGYTLGAFDRMIQAGVPPEILPRLAGLVTARAAIVAKRLNLSRKQERVLSDLQSPLSLSAIDDDRRLIQLKANHDVELLLGKSWLAQINEQAPDISAWNRWRERLVSVPEMIFPLSGKDLIELGVPEGPVVGRSLREIKNWWLREGCLPDSGACLKWFKEHSGGKNNRKD